MVNTSVIEYGAAVAVSVKAVGGKHEPGPGAVQTELPRSVGVVKRPFPRSTYACSVMVQPTGTELEEKPLVNSVVPLTGRKLPCEVTNTRSVEAAPAWPSILMEVEARVPMALPPPVRTLVKAPVPPTKLAVGKPVAPGAGAPGVQPAVVQKPMDIC